MNVDGPHNLETAVARAPWRSTLSHLQPAMTDMVRVVEPELITLLIGSSDDQCENLALT